MPFLSPIPLLRLVLFIAFQLLGPLQRHSHRQRQRTLRANTLLSEKGRGIPPATPNKSPSHLATPRKRAWRRMGGKRVGNRQRLAVWEQRHSKAGLGSFFLNATLRESWGTRHTGTHQSCILRGPKGSISCRMSVEKDEKSPYLSVFMTSAWSYFFY